MLKRILLQIILLAIMIITSVQFTTSANEPGDAPTHYEYALISKLAYDPDFNFATLGLDGLSDDWTLYVSQESFDGYFGIAYRNDKLNYIVIAHRGSQFALDDWGTSNALLSIGSWPAQTDDAMTFTSNVLRKINDEGYQNYTIVHTGHSLGGYLAEISAAAIRVDAVVFDSPGSKKVFEQLCQSPCSTTNVITYVGEPNFINTVNDHVGELRFIYGSWRILRNSYYDALQRALHIKDLLPTQDLENLASGLAYTANYGAYTREAHSIERLLIAFEDDGTINYDNSVKEWWPVGFWAGLTNYLFDDAPLDLQQSLSGALSPFEYYTFLSNYVYPAYNGQLDFVFVIDTTNSMTDDINAVSSQAQDIVDAIAGTNADYRIGLVVYRDHGYNQTLYPVAEVITPFSNDINQILFALQSLPDEIPEFPVGTNPNPSFEEAVYSGLMTAMDTNLFDWRDGVRKVILLIGDDKPQDPEPVTNYVRSDVLTTAFNLDPVNIYSIVLPDSNGNYPAIQEFADLSQGSFAESVQANNASVVVDTILNIIQDVSEAPLADAGGSYSGLVGQSILLDATQTITDRTIVRYEWDINGDGIYEIDTTTPTVNYIYSFEYTGDINLRVTDDAGEVGQASTTITISRQETAEISYYQGIQHWNDIESNVGFACSDTLSDNALNLQRDYGFGAPFTCPETLVDDWVGDYQITAYFVEGNYVPIIEHDNGFQLWHNNTLVFSTPPDDVGITIVCPPLQLNGLENIRIILREIDQTAHLNVSWTENLNLCDDTPPTGVMVNPTRADFLNNNFLIVESEVSDDLSGVQKVDFYAFSYDWTTPQWLYIDSDTTEPYAMDWFTLDVEDGFMWVTVDITDNNGNSSGLLIGDELWTFFTLDRSAPLSAVNFLDPAQENTTFTVSWQGSDEPTDITPLLFDIQYRDGMTGDWVDWFVGTSAMSAQFTGTEDSTYCFRSRAYDLAGNVEEWPDIYDTCTTLAPGAIIGEMTLSGRTGYSTELVVTIYDSATNAIVDSDVTQSDSNGEFRVPLAESGNYHVGVKVLGYLASGFSDVFLINAGNLLNFSEQLAGDANGDGIVNIFDFSIMANAFLTGPGDVGYRPESDFNNDGIINIFDFIQLSNHFLQKGWRPPVASNSTLVSFSNLVPSNAQQSDIASVSVSPVTSIVSLNETTSLRVSLDSGVSTFDATQINLEFDTNMLEVASMTPLDPNLTVNGPTLDALNGTIFYAAGSTSDLLQGAYDLLEIEFIVISEGTFNTTFTPSGDLETAIVLAGDRLPIELSGSILSTEVSALGDCNADLAVDAGDLSALQLEIFDGDSASVLDDISSGFAGNPIGCDANADNVIDAGDLSCAQRIIFDDQFVCGVAP